MKRTIKGIVAAAAILGLTTQVNAASDTANAVQIVTAALSITNTSDLDFGSAPQGDAAKTVLASDGTAASFDVVGTPSATYTVTLPANSTIKMITAGGGTADTEIAVDNFTSASVNSGALDGSGNDTLTVGATRALLSATQTIGNYSGTFTVTVAY